MTEKSKNIVPFESEAGLAVYLNKNYINQIKNYFSDEKKALKFLSSVRADVQRNPKLLECTPESIVNSYMQMAQIGFMPSTISGEGYVLPYNNNKKIGNEWKSIMEAQFQIGYQGFVTLFYTAGVEKITGEIIRKNDKFSYINGELNHEIDLFKSNKERGEAIGAYIKVVFRGETMVRFMNAKDILAHGARFSKSYDAKGKFSPWNPENDPELNMWKKTVLKQMAKLLPKNEMINKAIAIDNQDSIIGDRLESAKEESEPLKMKNLLTTPNESKNTKKKEENNEDNQDGPQGTESDTTDVIDLDNR
jgi:phage RecT family recombinase